VNDAMRVSRDIVFVRDQQYGIAGMMEPFKKRHNLIAGIGIESAGGLVGQQ
jgi:hypothetical protein